MTAPARFHPDLKIARMLPRTIVSRRTLGVMRALIAIAARLTRSGATRVTVADGQRLFLHRPSIPAATPTPALLWIHGGGLIMGAPELDAALCTEISARLGVIVAAPAYRLAPDHPYPAALEDVDAAFRWLAALPEVDPTRIAIAGDSAGGGLTACLAIHASRRDGPKPCFQLLHEPMLDEATCRRPDPDPASLRMWSANANRLGWGAYLAGVATPVPDTASAANVSEPDMAALPPAWLGCGTADLFVDETQAYAARLAAVGVPTEVRLIDGAFHGFLAFAAKARVASRYREAMIAALAEGLGLTPG